MSQMNLYTPPPPPVKPAPTVDPEPAHRGPLDCPVCGHEIALWIPGSMCECVMCGARVHRRTGEVKS